jgi:hypothetical protein
VRRHGIGWAESGSRTVGYFEADRLGLVPENERRAVSLLGSLCDPYRTGLYLTHGAMPAIGNATRRLYVVTRERKIYEFPDPYLRYVVGWCLHITSSADSPSTDYVLAAKSLIEGEELSFRATANPTIEEADSYWFPSNIMRLPQVQALALGAECEEKLEWRPFPDAPSIDRVRSLLFDIPRDPTDLIESVPFEGLAPFEFMEELAENPNPLEPLRRGDEVRIEDMPQELRRPISPQFCWTTEMTYGDQQLMNRQRDLVHQVELEATSQMALAV